MNSIVRLLLVIAGSISLAFGVIGIFLPVLPTTPFLLLASFCYVRSSERLHRWLLEHRVFGKYIYNYEVHRAIPKKTKISLDCWDVFRYNDLCMIAKYPCYMAEGGK